MNQSISKSLSSSNVSKMDLCIGCGACTGICPYKRMAKNRAVSLFDCDKINGRCDIFCPKSEFPYEGIEQSREFPIGKMIRILKSRAGKKLQNKFKRKKTISSISLFILENEIFKKILMNSVNEDNLSNPFFAENKEDILNNANTHYATTPLLDLMHRAKSSDYAIIGTPCQLYSLSKMENSPQELTPQYLPHLKIGLFCSWALEPKAYKDYLASNFPGKKINNQEISSGNNKKISFTFNDRIIHKDIDEIRDLIRNGCSTCTDLTSEFSDISVGEFEPDLEFNTLIIRTEIGEKIINEAVKQGYIEISKYPDTALESLTRASIVKKTQGFKKFSDILNSIE